MINPDYFRGNFLGGGLLFPSIGLRQASKRTTDEPMTENFSFLLELQDLQRSRRDLLLGEIETTTRAGRPPAEHPLEQILRRSVMEEAKVSEYTLAEFERDMDVLTEGLDDLTLQYRGSYSRDDIYLDDE